MGLISLVGWNSLRAQHTPCAGVLEVEGNHGALLAQLPDVTYEEAKAHIELIGSGAVTSLTCAGFCAEEAFVWNTVKSREVLRSEPCILDFKRKVRKIS